MDTRPLQRDPLLHADVGSILRRLDEAVARNDRAVRTQTRAEGAARRAHVAAVGGRAANARAEVVKAADLEAMADLPDAVEHRAVALIGRRQPVRAWAAQIVRHRERHEVRPLNGWLSWS